MKGERSATEPGKVVTDLRFFVAHIGDKVSKAELYCMYNSNLSLQCNFNLTVRVPVQVLRNEYTQMYSFNTYLGAIAIL